MTVEHNFHYKLVEKIIYWDGKKIMLLYGIKNDGSNEGLEIYFFKMNESHFYTSRRYLTDDIPSKYKEEFELLKSRVHEVPEGHKLTV